MWAGWLRLLRCEVKICITLKLRTGRGTDKERIVIQSRWEGFAMLKPILLVFENKRSAIVDKTTTDVMQAVAHSEFSNAFCVGDDDTLVRLQLHARLAGRSIAFTA